METSPKKQKPPLTERTYKQEQFRVEPSMVETLETISEKTKTSDNIPPFPPKLITPPPV